MRSTEQSKFALIAMLMVALNPALLFDSVVWGQSDSVLTLVMWLAVVATLAGEYEISWALAAVSVLIKPQGLMLVPVLGLWLLLEADYATWIRSSIVSLGTFIIGIAPFQIGHPWNWIIELYTSTAAYYHETSVNAFNFIALIGGLRQMDSGTIAGVSFFALGMALLVPLYSFVGYVLWRARNTKSLFYASFIALFGFFLFAPRMHERYLYPSLIFVVPLALESYEMMGVFVVLTITCLFNLAYIKQTLESAAVFLDPHDGLAMLTSILNVAAFAISVRFGLTMLKGEAPATENALAAAAPSIRAAGRANEDAHRAAAGRVTCRRCRGLRTDTIIVGVLVLAAIATRFWHIGNPPEIVFDEVHFVGQARHYLHCRNLPRPASASGEAADRAGHLAVRRSFVELAGRQRDARHDPGRRDLSARAPDVQGSPRGHARGGLRVARWILPGRFAHRMHRYRVPDLRRDLLRAAVPLHADRRAAGKAQDC